MNLVPRGSPVRGTGGRVHAVGDAGRGELTACGRLPRAGTRFTRAGARFTRAGARLPRAVTASSRSLRGCRGRRLVSKSRMVSFLYHIISSLQTRRTTRALAANGYLLASSKTTALGSRPACAGTPLLKRPVGTRGTASMQDARCPKELRRNRTRHAADTFSGHCQRSRRICEQKCAVGRASPLSDDRRLSESQ